MTNVPTLVDISIQPIELCKLLKIANMVGGGGEAKIVISEGYVLLNDNVEFQKRKKVHHNDVVEFNGEIIRVNYVEPDQNQLNTLAMKQAEIAISKQHKAKRAKKNKTSVSDNAKSAPVVEVARAKRKPISF